jgi:hypothetical protein
MKELGFGKVRQVAAIPVYMSGSRRQLNAYCFVRDEAPPAAVAKRKGRAASPALDLSTMPGFSPDNVIGVLASQASDRATAKLQADGSAEAVNDTTSARDCRPQRSAASGRSRGGAPSGRSGQPKALSGAGLDSAVEFSQHGYGLRRRSATRAEY